MQYYLYNSGNTPTIIENPFQLNKGNTFIFENIEYEVLTIIKTSEEDMKIFCKRVIGDKTHFSDISFKETDLDYEIDFFNCLKSYGIDLDKDRLTEQNLTEAFCSLFEKDFDIKHKVSGKHFSGKKVCIDLMLTPKDVSALRNKNISIGIEIKNPFTYGDNGRRNSDLYAQCLDYAQSTFVGYENVIILMFPTLKNFQNEVRLSRFLSRYNVGNVKLYPNSYWFKLGQEAFWSSEKGFIGAAKKSMMQVKTGNRKAKLKL